MSKIRYKSVNFGDGSLTIIKQANRILAEYAERGIIVTLRQLYYQFVARDLIPNKQSEYKRLGSVINDARLAGLIDWNYLQDRTRNLNRQSSWDDPGGVIRSAAASYHRNLWAGQEIHVEVWIEKDALIGVIELICEEWDVPYFSCRGYTSQSEMWGAGQRLLREIRAGRAVRIIHLGDHDPSGKDMSRDIEDRLKLFIGHDHDDPDVEINRIALNMDQVERYNPPPNPTKVTDSRASGYIAEFGHESWELDALDPDVLVALIRDNILANLNLKLWEKQRDRQEEERKVLDLTSRNWPRVSAYVVRTFGGRP
jgi:hypothetical protein